MSVIWSFNNDTLFDLVRSGRKTATCWLYDEKTISEQVGDIEYIVNSVGESIAIQITDISVRRFADIDDAWAKQEGEGDLSLQYWQDIHKKFFKQICGISPTNNTKLVCMQFRLI